MALFHITIEKVVVKESSEIKDLLEQILCLLKQSPDEEIKQEIADKLDKAIADIKSTIKN